MEILNLNATAQPNCVHKESSGTAVNFITSVYGQCGCNFCYKGCFPALRCRCMNCGILSRWTSLCKKTRRSFMTDVEMYSEDVKVFQLQQEI